LRYWVLLPAFALAAAVAACSTGSGDSRSVPASPVGPSEGNSANLGAPTAVSPSDDTQLDTVRPTLTVSNATASGSGARTYEFQVSDNTGFTVVAGRIGAFVVAVTQAGIAEGAGGQTSFTVPSDLLPSTRYFWRARAQQGGSTGPWSNTLRFRTKVDSFKNGNQAFDLLTNGKSVSDQTRNVSWAYEGDPNPGVKLEAPDSYVRYAMAPLNEGEVSFIARRVKPGSYYGKILSMQDGTGDFNSNGFRVRVEKRPPSESGKIVFQFGSQNNIPSQVETSGLGWVDNSPYFFKLEWRGGTARLRVFSGENESAPGFADVSTSYTAPWNAPNPNIIIGSLGGDSHWDIRVSRLYIGPYARPMSVGHE
jgi:hypothetical protein